MKDKEEQDSKPSDVKVKNTRQIVPLSIVKNKSDVNSNNG